MEWMISIRSILRNRALGTRIADRYPLGWKKQTRLPQRQETKWISVVLALIPNFDFDFLMSVSHNRDLEYCRYSLVPGFRLSFDRCA